MGEVGLNLCTRVDVVKVISGKLSSSGTGHSRTAPENSISKLQRRGPGA